MTRRVFAAFSIALLLNLAIINPVAAQEVVESDRSISIKPSGFVYDQLVNIAEPLTTTNFDTWPTNDTGRYVGAYIPESSHQFTHLVEEPSIARINFTWQVLFSSSATMSGAIYTRIRLPFILPNDASMIISLVDIDENRTILDNISLLNNSLSGDIRNEAGRTFLYYGGHLLSDTLYNWTITIGDLTAGQKLTFFLTDEDISSDGQLGGEMTFFDEYSGTPNTVTFRPVADFGISYLFIQGTPRNGIAGVDASLSLANPSLQLRRENMNLTGGILTNASVYIHIPVYNVQDQSMSYNVTLLELCGLTLISSAETHVFRDGLVIRKEPVDMTTITQPIDSCDVTIIMEPLNINSDDVNIAVRIPDSPITLFNDNIVTYLDDTGQLRRHFATPILKVAIFKAYVTPPPSNDLLTIVGDSTDFVSNFISSQSFSFLHTIFQTTVSNIPDLPEGISVTATVQAIAVCSRGADTMTRQSGLGVTKIIECARNVPGISSAPEAAQSTIDLITSLVNENTAFAIDIGNDVVTTISLIGDSYEGFGSGLIDAFLEPLFTIGKEIITIIQTIIDLVLYVFSWVLVGLLYILGVAIIWLAAAIAGIITAMFQLILRGESALIPRMIRGLATREELGLREGSTLTRTSK